MNMKCLNIQHGSIFPFGKKKAKLFQVKQFQRSMKGANALVKPDKGLRPKLNELT